MESGSWRKVNACGGRWRKEFFFFGGGEEGVKWRPKIGLSVEDGAFEGNYESDQTKGKRGCSLNCERLRGEKWVAAKGGEGGRVEGRARPDELLQSKNNKTKKIARRTSKKTGEEQQVESKFIFLSA